MELHPVSPSKAVSIHLPRSGSTPLRNHRQVQTADAFCARGAALSQTAK